jgi:hypothetical protein
MMRTRGFFGPLFQKTAPGHFFKSAGNYIAISGFQPFLVLDGETFVTFEVLDGSGGYVSFDVR